MTFYISLYKSTKGAFAPSKKSGLAPRPTAMDFFLPFHKLANLEPFKLRPGSEKKEVTTLKV